MPNIRNNPNEGYSDESNNANVVKLDSDRGKIS